MKVFTILGARPQFIKAAPVSRAFHQAGIDEFILHTGQHYDENMSQRFFAELELPPADINLGIGSGSHGWQTGQMLSAIEPALQDAHPDWVVVYGDTNSTLAGSLAAAKLGIPLAHIEAGLRSFNRSMPEEHNRVLADHCADLLFCPTQTAVDHLKREGLAKRAHLVGDVMYDAALQFGELAQNTSQILQELGLQVKEYLLATLHRPSNTDSPERLGAVIDALAELDLPVVFPLHPRTRQKLIDCGIGDLLQEPISNRGAIIPIPATGYLDMLALEQNALLILTDSGGVQKEAYFFAVPCLTLRTETEWPETLRGGWNRLVDPHSTSLVQAVNSLEHFTFKPPEPMFGEGNASQKIVAILSQDNI